MGKKPYKSVKNYSYNTNQIVTRSKTKKDNLGKLDNKSSKTNEIKHAINKKLTTKDKTSVESETNSNTKKMEKPSLDMLLLHLPPFDGRKESNIKFYLKQFEDLAKSINLEDAQKLTILKAKFSATARETLTNSPELYEEENFTTFKTKIQEEFQSRKTLEEIQAEFKNLKQKPDQSIDEFVKVFKIKASKYIQKLGLEKKDGAKELFDKIKLQDFLGMIRADIALEVRKQTPETLEKAIEIAKSSESAFNAMPKHENFNNMLKENDSTTETLLNLTSVQMDEIQKLKQKFEKLQTSTDNEKRKDNVNSKYCHICNISFHSTQECFYNGRNKINRGNTPQNNYDTTNKFNKQYQAPVSNQMTSQSQMAQAMYPQMGFNYEMSNMYYPFMTPNYNPNYQYGRFQNQNGNRRPYKKYEHSGYHNSNKDDQSNLKTENRKDKQGNGQQDS